LQSLQPHLIEAGDPYRLAWAVLDAADGLGIPAVAFCHSNLALLAAQARRANRGEDRRSPAIGNHL
jgi:alpha-1,6-mannosyltransferase